MNPADFIPTSIDIRQAFQALGPLLLYVLGMVVYSILIFKFYRFVASKDIFEFDLTQYEQSRFKPVRVILHVVLYIAKYLVLFPFLAFIWFAVLTTLLSILSRNQPLETVLLVSMALVATIRITSYYNEDLSRDLSKILPFALLGVFIVDVSYFRVDQSLNILKQSVTQREIITYYLMLVILLEFLLRITTPVVKYMYNTMTAQPEERKRPSRRRGNLSGGAAQAD